MPRGLGHRKLETVNDPNELFDIVDERDQVIGQAPRGQVHREGLWHRAVHILIFNRRGELFLQKRSMAKDSFPGAWDSSASGHLDAGEDYDTAAWRELEEEIGLTLPAAPHAWFGLPATARTGWEFVHVYRMEHEGPFILNPEEITEGRWWDMREFDRWLQTARPGECAEALRLIWEIIRPELRLPHE